MVVVVSVSAASPEQLHAAIPVKLASLYEQGVKLDQATGVLVVISVAFIHASINYFEAITSTIAESLPDTISKAATMPMNDQLQDCRVTLFFATPSTVA